MTSSTSEQRRVGPVHDALDPIEAREACTRPCSRRRRVVVAAVALADPTVDVVAVVLPVAGLDLVDDLDAARATCTTCSRTSARRRGGPARRGRCVTGLPSSSYATITSCAPRLVEREALGVRAVERREPQTPARPAARRPGRGGRRSSRRVHCTSGTRQPVTHWKSLVSSVGGSALQLGVGERERLVDEPVDRQPVVGLGSREGSDADDRVDAEPADRSAATR